jgi:hypothetical protein
MASSAGSFERNNAIVKRRDRAEQASARRARNGDQLVLFWRLAIAKLISQGQNDTVPFRSNSALDGPFPTCETLARGLCMRTESTRSPVVTMRCMEIRGDNRAIEESFETPGLSGWIYSRPYQGAESGGDLHYISVCGGGVITRVVVADVSGHGATVSQFSTALRSLMRKNINTKSQTRLVRSLNRDFGESAQLQQFATAVVATYLATQQSLTICNAGHPRPLWYRAISQEWLPLDESIAESGNLPLGLDDESTYHQFAVRLRKGDLVVFYTDALTEAQNTSGRMLGEDALLDMARGARTRTPAELGPALLSAVASYRGNQPADDDVTLLVLAHDGSGPKPPKLSEKLDVYAKVFGLKAV